MTVLVTGGAAYIGSYMVRELVDAGERVAVLDNLSTGFAWLVPLYWYRRIRYDLTAGELEAVYGWFTEGFDTLDLKQAKALLETLS